MYVALVSLVFILITALPYLVGSTLGETAGEVVSKYVSFISLLVILAATLFASVVIVSEFEERTALILFTRPIKRTSIFVGKVIGCIVLETTMLVAFYAAMAIAMFVIGGGVSVELLTSLGLTILFVFATSSIAVLISSVMKRGSTCAILTFVLLLLILPIITGVFGGANMETWFMLDEAANSISTCIPEYVDRMNEMLAQLGERFDMDLGTIDPPDLVKSAGTMLGWGIVSLFLAWIAFIRREF